MVGIGIHGIGIHDCVLVSRQMSVLALGFLMKLDELCGGLWIVITVFKFSS